MSQKVILTVQFLDDRLPLRNRNRFYSTARDVVDMPAGYDEFVLQEWRRFTDVLRKSLPQDDNPRSVA